MLCCIFSIEVIINIGIRNILEKIRFNFFKVIKVLNSDIISDHWKEKMIPYYSILIFKKSFTMFLLLLFIILIFLIPYFFEKTFLNYAVSLMGIIESIAICYSYLYIRKLVVE